MPTGLKETSSLIMIGFDAPETAANTFTEVEVDLQLNALDQEVFVIYGAALDISSPDVVLGVNTGVFASVSQTTRTTVGSLTDSNVIATAGNVIQGGIADGVGFSFSTTDAPSTQLEYLGIIATSQFFVQIEGQNNVQSDLVTGRLWGVRAKASAAIYASLVQSELLSA
jgi:hypothetical protein